MSQTMIGTKIRNDPQNLTWEVPIPPLMTYSEYFDHELVQILT